MKAGKLISYTVSEQEVNLQFEQLSGMISIITSTIVRVFADLDGIKRRSQAIEGDKTVSTDIVVEQKANGLWIRTEKMDVRVSDGFYVDFYDKDGVPVCCDYRGNRKPLERISSEHIKLLISEGHEAKLERDCHHFEVLKAMTGSEHFYGLGDKTGYLDKRHYDYEMWNTDNCAPQVDCFKALYKSIPFFMTLTDTHVYGIFLDNTFKTYFNMAQESEDYYWFASDGGNLDYYYIAGQSLPEVLQQYTYLTGTCPLPQKWTLGYHQSRWGYMYQEDFEKVASGMRDNDIPCDALHFDIDYMDNYKVFTWNEKRYHDNSKGFLKHLIDNGFKPVTINDPGVKKEEGYYVYEEGVKNGYFAKTPDGEVYINAVWPGDSAFPDFGNPVTREWWGEKQQFLLDQGVRGIWNDMNEPASFNGPLPDDVVFSDEDRKINHAEMHNMYGHQMAKATYNALKKLDGRRPFVITRACYAGTQKYSTAWTGDNHSMWGHLQMAIPQLCNLGLSGMPFAGTDIGGFGSDTTPELLTRWIQVGCFSPLCRNHCRLGKRLQEPWEFSNKVLEIYRKYVKLRYQLIPYFYDLFFEGEKTGAPIMRPLVYHYENDPVARTCNDEFMVGDHILVAPVVFQGMDHRMVYLPEGEWYDYWTKEKLVGPIRFIREAPLDTCPIYVKAGSILPTMETQSYVGEKENDTLILEVYPGEAVYDHYLDNGEDFDYREGKYHQYRFAVDGNGIVTMALIHAGYEKPYKKILVKGIDGRVTELR